MTTTSRDRGAKPTAHPAPRGRRRAAGDRRPTRDRLLDAAVRLLKEEGEAALSTTRLTHEVGIVQSGFYSHFPTVEACVAEAAAIAVQEVRVPVRQWLAELEQQGPAPTELVVERTTAHFERVLAMLQSRWSWLQLLERYRHGPGQLGEAMARVHDEIVADVRGHLATGWEQSGLSADRHGPRLDLLAELIVEMVVSVAGLISADPQRSRSVAAETLAVGTNAMVEAGIEAALRADGRSLAAGV